MRSRSLFPIQGVNEGGQLLCVNLLWVKKRVLYKIITKSVMLILKKKNNYLLSKVDYIHINLFFLETLGHFNQLVERKKTV